MQTTLTHRIYGMIAGMLFAAAAPAGLAVQITGDIDLGGSATYNTNSLATASQLTGVTNGRVTGTSGNYDAIPVNTAVTFNLPYVFNSSADVLLWSIAGGWTFTLDNSTISAQTAQLLFVTGTGTLAGPGFEPTPGTWSFTSTQSDGSTSQEFSFSTNNTAQPGRVPDGGSSLVLLGTALLGIGALARHLVRR